MFKKSLMNSRLTLEIETKLYELRKADFDGEEYDKILTQLERLYKMNESQIRSRVSPDTWALIGANLFGIVIIITHEYAHPITTKALSLAMRLK